MEDLEIIQNLIEHGPEFLNELNGEQRLNYEKLYLTENDIFEDNIKKYITCLNFSNKNFWINITEKLDGDLKRNITIDLINNIIDDDNTSISQKMNLLNKIIEPKSIQNLFSEQDYELWDSLLVLFFNELRCNSKLWEIEIQNLQMLIKKIINNKNNSRNIFVSWCSRILNISIQKINIDMTNYDHTLPSDYYLINMLGVFLNFWMEGINDQRLKILDYDYITSENCDIKWMNKKKTAENKDYSYLNQLLFLIFDTMRVGYIPTLHRTKIWNEYLKYIDGKIEELKNGTAIASSFVVSQLKNQREIIINSLEMGNIITSTKILNNWINNFYYLTTKWLKDQANQEKIIDDILYDYVKFYIHTKDIIIDNSIISFGIDIVGSKKYTANIDTRIEFAIFVGNNIGHEFPINFEEYSRALIISHNDLHSAHVRSDYKFLKKQEIYNLINKLLYYKQFEFKNSLKDNLEMTKKFLNVLLMDLSECNDTIDEFNEKINSNEITSIEKEDFIDGMINILKYYIMSLELIDALLTRIMDTESLINIIKSREISSALAIVINYLVFTYSSKINYEKYLNIEEITKLLDKIGGIIATLNIIEYDYTYIVDSYNFNIKYYIKFNKKTTYGISSAIKEIKEKIKEIKEKETNENNIEYSDEFIDPITFTLIEEPCLLPDMVGFSSGDVYFDRSTIIKQLLIKDENPYTRKTLTIDQFNEFNKRPEIIKKLEDFKKRFSLERENKKGKI
ncbi:U-box domain protein [Indivirus ILV1]|uniref:Ubiquitin conjugation factor E4 A n=1 Tax=Indivirus ILV1 TaxID=1977633 RepID=A0A1V0SCI8_9VIRU|nr:U-box domain protein [Indivirus ILV1]